MVESGGLENRCLSNRTVGSNPTPSANCRQNSKEAFVLLREACGLKGRLSIFQADIEKTLNLCKRRVIF